MAERDRAAVRVEPLVERVERRAAADGITWAANASLISTTSTSSMVIPARSSALRRLDRPDPHELRLDAGHGRRDDARQRLDAELLRPLVAHEHDRRGAVVERARVPGGDLAARGTPASARRASRASSRAAARRRARRVPPPSARASISRSKKPSSCAATARCCLRYANRSISSRVISSALGDVLRGLPHRDVHVRDRVRLPPASRSCSSRSTSGSRDTCEIDSTPAADEDVALAGTDRVGGHADRLQDDEQ